MRLLITQHCFAVYRTALFRAILRGGTGAEATLAFGTLPMADNLKVYGGIDDVPDDNEIQDDQYRVLRNVWLKKPLLWQRGVMREIKSGGYDAVVLEGNPFHLSTWMVLVRLRRTSVRVGLWSHGSRDKLTGLRRWCARRFFGLADFVLLYGEWGHRHLIDAGVDPQKLYPFHNSLDYAAQKQTQAALDTRKVQELRDRLFSHPKHPVLLWVGRMSRQRRLDLLIAAAALLHEQGTPVNLLFVGPDDGQTESFLREELEEANLSDYATFYGACYDETVTGMLFNMAAALVYPGPVGLGAIHAMAYGTPVVTTNDWSKQKPEADSVLPGITGEFFEDGDMKSLATAILPFLNMASEERQRMADACERVVAQYYTPEYQCRILSSALKGESPAGWNWQESLINEYCTAGT